MSRAQPITVPPGYVDARSYRAALRGKRMTEGWRHHALGHPKPVDDSAADPEEFRWLREGWDDRERWHNREENHDAL